MQCLALLDQSGNRGGQGVDFLLTRGTVDLLLEFIQFGFLRTELLLHLLMPLSQFFAAFLSRSPFGLLCEQVAARHRACNHEC